MRFQGQHYDIKNHNDTTVYRHFKNSLLPVPPVSPVSEFQLSFHQKPIQLEGWTLREIGKKTLDTPIGNGSTKGSKPHGLKT